MCRIEKSGKKIPLRKFPGVCTNLSTKNIELKNWLIPNEKSIYAPLLGFAILYPDIHNLNLKVLLYKYYFLKL